MSSACDGGDAESLRARLVEAFYAGEPGEALAALQRLEYVDEGDYRRRHPDARRS